MRQPGFTLIELMIVVAIVGILAAIAIPTYQSYVARSQVSEAVARASEVKTMLTSFYSAQGSVWPPAGQYSDLNGGRYTQTVTHDNAGVMTITMRNAAPVSQSIRGTSLTVSPTLNAAGNAIINWNCAPVTMNIKYIPSGCQP